MYFYGFILSFVSSLENQQKQQQQKTNKQQTKKQSILY